LPHPSEGRSVDAYRAPLFIAWQLTNRCRARCLACCEESGPDRAWRDELTRDEALGLLRQVRSKVDDPVRAATVERIVAHADAGSNGFALDHQLDVFIDHERVRHWRLERSRERGETASGGS